MQTECGEKGYLWKRVIVRENRSPRKSRGAQEEQKESPRIVGKPAESNNHVKEKEVGNGAGIDV